MTKGERATAPATIASPHDDPQDFSLVLGGPLYQIYLRARLARPPLDLLPRRVVVIVAIAWLPLLVLSAIDGSVADRAIRIPFVHDFEAQARFLVALPVLIIADLFVHLRLQTAVGQFAVRGIVASRDLPRFSAAIEWAMRLRNSVALEIALLVFVYVIGLWVWRTHLALQGPSWYSNQQQPRLGFSAAGYWYAWVSIPIFQFMLLRWYLRLCIWFLFLWRVSRLDLQLIPTHPDRAGGLAFLSGSAKAFVPILFSQGALLAGLIANRIFYDGQTLLAFKVDVAGLIGLFVFLFLAPLTMFTPLLLRVKREGLREYGVLATDYSREFGEKWIHGGTPKRDDELLGSADIQSLADLGNSYATIRQMHAVPFGWDTVLGLALAMAAPILPLALTAVPLEVLVDRLIKMVF